MPSAATNISCDVDRGPDWLFIRPHLLFDQGQEALPVAETLWGIIDEHMIHRVVLELDQIGLLHSYLCGQLILVSKRLHAHGGVLRLCNLTSANEEVLRISRLDGALPCYPNRNDAVMGHRPAKPR
ncbi:MAG: STAS domain-containing protein [Planctomycetes bacterium]|nr:STAS domain-containing protein [Planctomycetota bacterium]